MQYFYTCSEILIFTTKHVNGICYLNCTLTNCGVLLQPFYHLCYLLSAKTGASIRIDQL